MLQLSLRKEILNEKVNEQEENGLVKFIDRLNDKYARLKVISKQTVSEQDMLVVLEKGLGSSERYRELKLWMAVKSPSTFNETIVYFKQFALNEKINQSDGKNKEANLQEKKQDETKEVADYVNQNPRTRNNNGYRGRNNNSSYGMSRPPFRCYNCGGLNHSKRNCPAPPQNQERNQNQNQNRPETTLFASETANAVFNRDDSETKMDYYTIYLDSGASNHIFGNKALFNQMKLLDNPIDAVVANGNTVEIEYAGEVRMTDVSSESKTINVTHVRWCPNFTRNLLSVSQLIDRGLKVTFDARGAAVIKDGQVIIRAKRVNNLFAIVNKTIPAEENILAVSESDTSNLLAWHYRLGHCNPSQLKSMRAKNSVIGFDNPTMNTPSSNQRLICNGCALGKSRRVEFADYSSRVPATRPLMRLFHDNSGAVRIPDLDNPSINQLSHLFGEYKYLSLIVDDYSGYLDGRVIVTKDKSVEHLMDMITFEENQTGQRVQVINADDSGEIRSKRLIEYCKQKGIRRNLANTSTSQHNGVVERAMRTVFESARALLQHAKLHPVFWTHAIMAAIYALNHVPTYRDQSKARIELFRGYKPSIKRLKVFGCDATVNILKKNRESKVERTAIKCIFIGYDELRENGYILFNPVSMKFVYSRDVLFHENEFTCGRGLFKKTTANEMIKNDNNDAEHLAMNYDFYDDDNECENSHDNDSINSEQESNPVSNELEYEDNGEAINEDNQMNREDEFLNDSPSSIGQLDIDQPTALNEEVEESKSVVSNPDETKYNRQEESRPLPIQNNYTSRSGRNIRPPVSHRDMIPSDLLKYVYSDDDDNQESYFLVEDGPTNYQEAMQRGDAKEWLKACETELKAHQKNGSWTLMKRKSDMHVIPSRWVFVIKVDPNTGTRKYKARFVVKGFKQMNGVDYFEDEVSSSVLASKSLRIILALTVNLGHELHQMDAVSAFTQSKLDQEIFAQQPDGFEIGKSMICSLNKAVYGLKQASYLWQHDIRNYMKPNGWNVSVLDENIYFRYSKTNRLMIVSTYVDDVISSYHPADENEFMEFVSKFKQRFDIKEIGKPESILGMRVQYDKTKRQLKLSQQKYIEHILVKYGMQNAKPYLTPQSEEYLGSEHCPTSEKDRAQMKKYPYRSLVGELLYLACTSRPDISHSIGVLTRFLENPGKRHWDAALRVLRYLRGTPDLGLTFNGNRAEDHHHFDIEAYSDADWGRDLHGRKSIYGFIIQLNGCPVSWISKKQSFVAQSTCESEYVGMSESLREIKWIQQLLGELGVKIPPPVLYGDNQSALDIASNTRMDNRIKSIDIKYHFIKDEVNKKNVIIRGVSSEANSADIFTKPLGKIKFNRFRNYILGNLY
jgi:hypothetical protein